MFAIVRFNGDAPESMIEDDGSLMVEFDWEAERVRYRCRSCDAVFPVEEDADDDPCMEAECTVHTGDENCDDHGCEYPGHDLVSEEEPLAWVNSAGIEISEDKNQVDVWISVGDPRGAFLMRMYKTEEGTIRMEVPYPGEPFAHMPLAPVHEGSQGHYIVKPYGDR